MDVMNDFQPRTYSVPQVAKILGIGRSLAYSLANSGGIKTVRLGKRILVPREEVERLLSVAA